MIPRIDRWAGPAVPTERITARVGGAGYAGWEPAAGPRPATLAARPGTQAAPRADGLDTVPATHARALGIWLAAVWLRLGDHLFAVNDTEASWRCWQVIKVHGGLGRYYRDPLFDTLHL